MTDFQKLLDWKLLAGSHPFPGPDGGTCINEAAIVVAGFPYQSITDPNEMPECFSRPIAALAMFLNDTMPDDQRQRLIPFIPRMAGTAHGRADVIRGGILHRSVNEWIRGTDTALCINARMHLAGTLNPGLWDEAIRLLDAMIAMTPQPAPIDIALIHARAEQAKRGALRRIPEAPPISD